MAHDGYNNIEKPRSISQMLECNICLEVMAEPQALQCLHNFCKKCIDSICTKPITRKKSVISCPLCRKVTPQDKVQDSFMMNSLLEIYQREEEQHQSNNDKGCVQCDRPNVTYICTDCQMKLCKDCKDRHLRIPSLRHHKIVDISEDKEITGYKNSSVMFCPKHPAYQIKFNCIPCQVVVCAECKVEKHDEHKTESVAEAFRKKVNLTKHHLVNIATYKRQYRERLSSVLTFTLQCRSDSEEIKRKIRSQTQRMIQRIQKDSNDQLKFIQSFTETQAKMLRMKTDELQKTIAYFESLQSKSQAIMEMPESASSLSKLQQGLYQRIEKCSKAMVLKDWTIENIVFTANTQIETMKSNTVGSFSEKSKFFDKYENSALATKARTVFATKRKYLRAIGSLTPSKPEPARNTRACMNIFVKTLTGHTISVPMSPCSKIHDLKLKLQEKEGIPAYKQMLVYRSTNKELQDFNTLANCGLYETTLQLKIKV